MVNAGSDNGFAFGEMESTSSSTCCQLPSKTDGDTPKIKYASDDVDDTNDGDDPVYDDCKAERSTGKADHRG